MELLNVLDVLDAWRIGPVRSVRSPGSGAINQTLLIAAESGDYVLRAYRHGDARPVEVEHAVIAFVRARGLPAVGPIALPSGATILERAGRFFALFPHAPGRQLGRAELGATEVAAMGRFLARLHRALAGLPAGLVHERPVTVDAGATLVAIGRYATWIRALGEPAESDRYALARLEGQRAWIERHPDASMRPLAALEQQAIHGDYTETNLFFDAACVSAIIDWDQTYRAPRAWEVVRTLDLAFGYAPEPAREFLAAYRAELPLAWDELDVAAASYGLMRAHDLWMYAAIYDGGNERVRAFLGPEGFVVHGERWAALRRALG